MKVLLEIASTITIDTSDLDPDQIKEVIADLDLYTDENGDVYKNQEDLSDEEWNDVIKHLLENDLNSVVDLESEITDKDIRISIPPREEIEA